MSYAPPPPTDFFAFVQHERRFAIDELDVVVIGSAVEADDGRVIPAGSMGTVVAVWGEAEAFEVEFAEPLHALATVAARLISESRQTH